MRKLSGKQQDKLIDSIYREHCSGMRIDIMRIPALFDMARAMLDVANRDAIGAAMAAFIATGQD